MQNLDRPEWVNLLPMVKVKHFKHEFLISRFIFCVSLQFLQSVVRAMDTVQDYVKKNNWGDIQHFAVAGASKRGWTTWLTGTLSIHLSISS